MGFEKPTKEGSGMKRRDFLRFSIGAAALAATPGELMAESNEDLQTIPEIDTSLFLEEDAAMDLLKTDMYQSDLLQALMGDQEQWGYDRAKYRIHDAITTPALFTMAIQDNEFAVRHEAAMNFDYGARSEALGEMSRNILDSLDDDGGLRSFLKVQSLFGVDKALQLWRQVYGEDSNPPIFEDVRKEIVTFAEQSNEYIRFANQSGVELVNHLADLSNQ